MSWRNTSQRPLEPPQDRSDRLRAGRLAPTSSARREKQALHPPRVGRGRGGRTRLARVDAVGGQCHRRVHPRWLTRHSISRIIRCMSKRRIMRIILRSLSLTVSFWCVSEASLWGSSWAAWYWVASTAGWYWAASTAWWWGSCSGGADGGVRGRTGRLWRGALWPHAFTSLWWT